MTPHFDHFDRATGPSVWVSNEYTETESSRVDLPDTVAKSGRFERHRGRVVMDAEGGLGPIDPAAFALVGLAWLIVVSSNADSEPSQGEPWKVHGQVLGH